LWHFDGAGIGFPQRSCNAEARCVAKVLPWGELVKQGGYNRYNLGADTNPPEDPFAIAWALSFCKGRMSWSCPE
jgi:hypothetical protein